MNIFIIMKTGSLVFNTWATANQPHTPLPLLSLCLKNQAPWTCRKKLHPQTVHFHGCIRPDDFTFGHIPHLYSTCALSADYIKFVLVLYPTLTGNPLQWIMGQNAKNQKKQLYTSSTFSKNKVCAIWHQTYPAGMAQVKRQFTAYLTRTVLSFHAPQQGTDQFSMPSDEGRGLFSSGISSIKEIPPFQSYIILHHSIRKQFLIHPLSFHISCSGIRFTDPQVQTCQTMERILRNVALLNIKVWI